MRVISILADSCSKGKGGGGEELSETLPAKKKIGDEHTI